MTPSRRPIGSSTTTSDRCAGDVTESRPRLLTSHARSHG
jgi:hypothetical protein